jgi:hypothetical protein
MADELQERDIQMDAANLYREETFTDRRVGTIQRLTPVKTDGSRDDSRTERYLGQTQILTPAGALPLSFEIVATTLAEAAEKFGEGAQEALEGTMQRLEELRREAASSLIVPGSGGGGGFPGGGRPGGGLQIP